MRSQPTNIAELLQWRAEAQPERLAFSSIATADSSPRAMTRGDLYHDARRFGARLTQLGERGDRVLIVSQDSLDFLTAFFGCIFAGRIPVPSHPPRGSRGIRRLRLIAEDCGAKIAATDIMPQAGCGLDFLLVREANRYDTDLGQEPFGAHDIAFLQYTSGSTGNPKGVIVSHENVRHNVKAIADSFQQNADSVLVCWLPLFHDMGLVGNILLTVFTGGHCVLLPPGRVLQHPLDWLSAITRFRATASGGPNFAYDLCSRRVCERDLEGLDLRSWRVAYNGSEMVRHETMERFTRLFAPAGFQAAAFRPCYGLAENTLYVSTGVSDGRLIRGNPSCGKPALDTHVAIVDSQTLQLRAEGEAGEIWIASPSVAQGYWNKPDSESTFRAKCPAGSDRTYLRTGDIGLMSDGELYVLDRLKDTIIIGGRNLHAADIETTALELAGSASAAIAAVALRTLSEESVALFVECDSTPDFASVVRGLRTGIVQEHDIAPKAIAFVRKGLLPRTTSGKIRRHECRELLDGHHLGLLYVWREGDDATPITRDIRSSIATWIASRLKVPVETISSDVPIASFGLDSLGAVTLAHHVQAETGMVLDLARILSGATLDDVAKSATRAEERHELEPERRQRAPLSHGQEALLYLDRLSGAERSTNISVAMTVRGALDPERLHRTLARLQSRHDVLRTTIAELGEGPIQQVHAELPLDIEWPDGSPWTESALHDYLRAQANLAFDLAAGPLWRTRVVGRASGEHVLLWVIHHIACDLWSTSLLLAEFAALWESGDTLLEVPAPSFIEYVCSERRRLESAEGEADLAYWRAALGNAPDRLRLPAWRSDVLTNSASGESVRTVLSDHASKRLRATAAELGATVSTLLLSAWQIVLWRLSGQNRFRVATAYAGRHEPRFRNTVGYFVNLLVVPAELRDEMLFTQLIAQTRDSGASAIRHGRYPYSLLSSQLRGDFRGDELFDTVFVMQSSPHDLPVARFAIGMGESLRLGELEVKPLAFDPGYAQFDLALTAADLGEQYAFDLRFRSSHMHRSFADRMLVALSHVLEQITAYPRAPLALLALQRQEFSEATPSPRQSASAETLVERFEKIATAHPDAIALQAASESVRYCELNRRADALAHRLIVAGVRAESLVGIWLDRVPDLPTAMLATLKAGGAYVPIDRTCPHDRLVSLVATTRPTVLITSRQYALPAIPTSVRVVHVEDIDNADPKSFHPPRIFPEQIAYVIHTSGSTGIPKGTLVSHCNVVRLFDSTEDLFHFGVDDCWTMFHSPAFDFSVWEIWGALLYGGRLVIPSREVTRSPENFCELLSKERVTVLNQTPTAFRELAREASSLARLDALRLVIFGGERLEPGMLGDWVSTYGFERPRLVNMYGITETTVHVTHRVLTEKDMQWSHRSPIGESLPDLGIHLLDSSGNAQPAGAVGLMYVSGSGVARGYLDRPDLTAERFVPDAHSGVPGSRMYASGDLAVISPDAGLEYLGRSDQQIKIRGHRIEPGEVQAAMAAHPLVQDCVALPFRRRDGEMDLVLYVISAGSAPTTSELRAFASCKLPDYMRPSSFVVVDAWPRTINGKLDCSALPSPAPMAAPTSVHVAPRNPIEAQLAAAFAEVMRLEMISIEDNYFDLGIDSIRSIRVLARLKEGGISVSLQDFMGCSTVADLALRTHELESQSSSENPSSEATEWPLTSVLAGLVFESQHSDQYESYVTTLHVQSSFDEISFRKAIAFVTERHPVLRTTFDFDSYAEPMQVVHSTATPAIEIFDFRYLEEPQQHDRMRHFLDELRSVRPVWEDLPLARWFVHLLGDDSFQFTLHEPFLDGWSVGAILTDVLNAYGALQNGREPVQRALQCGPAEHARLERDARDSSESQVFWDRMLTDLPGSKVPSAVAPQGPGPVVRRREVGVERRHLDALRAIAATLSVPFKSVLLAVHVKTLSIMTGASDIVTGILMNGRPESGDGDKIAGLFVNPVPFRTRLRAGQSWSSIIREVHRMENEILPHRRYPYAEMRRRKAEGSLFECLFNFTNFHLYSDLERATGVKILDAYASEQTYFDLTAQFHIDRSSRDLLLALDYRASRFDSRLIDRMLACYEQVISSVVTSSDSPHDFRSVVPAADQRIIGESNRTEEPWDVNTTLHELIESTVRRCPQAEAVRFENTALSYAELNARANQMARVLRRSGVRPDDVVAVTMDRSLELVVMLLAILKSGAAYLPLDRSNPPARLNRILSDVDARLLITDRAPATSAISFDVLQSEAQNETSENLGISRHPDGLAYVIHTSGSTGVPKSAMNTHRGIVNRLLWMQKQYGLREGERVLQKTPYTFDVSVWEFFWPLIAGACVVEAAPDAHLDPAYLAELIHREHISVVHFVPAMLRSFLDETTERFPSLRQVISSGEALPRELAEAWEARCSAPLDNLYGPAEVSIDVTWHPHGSWSRTMVPIGKPIANTRVYVLNSNLEPLPVDVPGEIFLAGIGVGRGYRSASEITAERFLPDPFTTRPGERMYRTGDLGRWLGDGTIEFLGRLDHQVKIRGQRVEMGEIEAALRQIDGVRDAVALFVSSKLIAWLQTEDGSALPLDEVRNGATRLLPRNMIPQIFRFRGALPLNRSGKVDRKLLAEEETAREDALRLHIRSLDDSAVRELLEQYRVVASKAE